MCNDIIIVGTLVLVILKVKKQRKNVNYYRLSSLYAVTRKRRSQYITLYMLLYTVIRYCIILQRNVILLF